LRSPLRFLFNCREPTCFAVAEDTTVDVREPWTTETDIGELQRLLPASDMFERTAAMDSCDGWSRVTSRG